jgi:urea-proton symporter
MSEADANTILNPTVGWILLLLFGAAWIGLGIYWGRRAKSFDGFMLAGRNVGMALGSATAMATWVTSNTVMLAPVFALEKGIWGMLAYSTASFGLLLFAPLSARIRQLIPKGYTSGDFMRLRYGKFAWVLFLLITVVYSMAWLVSMGTAGGKLLETLSGIPYVNGMTMILFVCVVYTLFGGLYAVIGTDFIQSIIILIGVVLVGALVLVKTDMSQVYQSMELNQPSLINALMPVALLSLFNNMFFGFGEVFHNNVWWSRAYAMRKDVAPRAFFVSGLLWFPIPIAAGFIALSASALGINVVDPNTVGPLVASSVLGKSGAILVFIVVFCSLASSIDSLLAATSDLLVEDVGRKMLGVGQNEDQLRMVSKLVICGLGILTWILCAREMNLLEILFLSGPLVASAIWPVLGGLYWKRASSSGAVLAMILGSVVGLVAYYKLGWYTASLISAAISMGVMLIFTSFQKQDFDWNTISNNSN